MCLPLSNTNTAGNKYILGNYIVFLIKLAMWRTVELFNLIIINVSFWLCKCIHTHTHTNLYIRRMYYYIYNENVLLHLETILHPNRFSCFCIFLFSRHTECFGTQYYIKTWYETKWTVTTVSYTHLDVYKRQLLGFWFLI